jgi:hypothetical protein
VAAIPKAWVCCRCLAGMVGSNPDKGMDFYLSSIMCCPVVEVFATAKLLVQRSPTECDVSECYRETS